MTVIGMTWSSSDIQPWWTHGDTATQTEKGPCSEHTGTTTETNASQENQRITRVKHSSRQREQTGYKVKSSSSLQTFMFPANNASAPNKRKLPKCWNHQKEQTETAEVFKPADRCAVACLIIEECNQSWNESVQSSSAASLRTISSFSVVGQAWFSRLVRPRFVPSNGHTAEAAALDLLIFSPQFHLGCARDIHKWRDFLSVFRWR